MPFPVNRRMLILVAGVVLVSFVALIYSREKSFSDYLASIKIETCKCENEENDKETKSDAIRYNDWRTVNATEMTANEIVEYLHFDNRTSCNLIHDIGGMMLTYNGFSGIDGQKAMCLDSGIGPDPKGCVVYSFGVRDDWSFDEFMGKYGCQVFSFDPSIGSPDHDHSSSVHFYNLGLGDKDGSKNGWKIKTLSSIYEMLKNKGHHSGDAIIDYLKIDIEFDEWIALPDILASGMIHRIRQMGIEIHLPRDDGIDYFRKLVGIVKAIEDSGMVRFDSKYNPWFMDTIPALNYSGSRGFEIAWYRRF